MHQNYNHYLLTLEDLENLHYYLVHWSFAPQWFQMMSGYMNLAHYYWIYPPCLCEMLYRWKTWVILFLPGKLIFFFRLKPFNTVRKNLHRAYFSLLWSCSLSRQIRLVDLKGIIGCEGEIYFLYIGGNDSILLLRISLLFPSSVNISSIFWCFAITVELM